MSDPFADYQPNYSTCPHCKARLCDGEIWSHPPTCSYKNEDRESGNGYSSGGYSSGSGCCIIL